MIAAADLVEQLEEQLKDLKIENNEKDAKNSELETEVNQLLYQLKQVLLFEISVRCFTNFSLFSLYCLDRDDIE